MNKTVVAIPAKTVVDVHAAANAQTVNLRRGVVYRVVSDVDIWINKDGATATNVDCYVPSKVVEIFAFENADSQLEATKPISVLTSAAGRVYFTALIPAVA